MGKKNKGRIGRGMKPRGTQAGSGDPQKPLVATAETLSAIEGQEVAANEGQDAPLGQVGNRPDQESADVADDGTPIVADNGEIEPGDLESLLAASAENPSIKPLPEPEGEAWPAAGLSLGQQPDGTYRIVVTIPEGVIAGIEAQADSDRVTPESWVSTRLAEYLESWWQPARSK